MKNNKLKVEVIEYNPPKDGNIVRREKHIDAKGNVVHDMLYFNPPLNGETVRADRIQDGDRAEICEYDKNDHCILRTYFHSSKKADR